MGRCTAHSDAALYVFSGRVYAAIPREVPFIINFDYFVIINILPVRNVYIFYSF